MNSPTPPKLTKAAIQAALTRVWLKTPLGSDLAFQVDTLRDAIRDRGIVGDEPGDPSLRPVGPARPEDIARELATLTDRIESVRRAVPTVTVDVDASTVTIGFAR